MTPDPADALYSALEKVVALLRRSPSMQGKEHDALGIECNTALARYRAGDAVRKLEKTVIESAIKCRMGRGDLSDFAAYIDALLSARAVEEEGRVSELAIPTAKEQAHVP